MDDIKHLFSSNLKYRFNTVEQDIINGEINKSHIGRKKQIISPIFLRMEKNGKYRMVLNLEKLNLHIPYKHFKMENFDQVISLINAGDYLASVDLRHAYYSVKITEDQQRFFCFNWQGVTYQFTCLPNGISEGSRIFTKVMKPVYSTLRNKGYTITSFIDDSLICSSSMAGCIACVHDTIALLRKLGFCVNEGKSVLVPTKRIEYLGNIIDIESMKISLPERRVMTLVQACQAITHKDEAQIRQVARVIGLMVAATPAVVLGKLHYRNLEKAKIDALKQVQGNFDARMTISEEMKSDLEWWCNNASVQDRDIFRSGADIELFTDASTIGWGRTLKQQSIGGSWSMEESLLHINVLELKAILLCLQTFRQELRVNILKYFVITLPL